MSTLTGAAGGMTSQGSVMFKTGHGLGSAVSSASQAGISGSSPSSRAASRAGSRLGGATTASAIGSRVITGHGSRLPSRAVSREGSKSSVVFASREGEKKESIDSTTEYHRIPKHKLRRVIAEDPEWSLATVPLLTELVVAYFVKTFQEKPILQDLPEKYKKKVIDKLPVNLPLPIVVDLIEDDSYWKRRSKDRWKVCDVSKFGNIWKRLYLERHLNEAIENFIPDYSDSAKLFETAQLASSYVVHLNITQLLPPYPKDDADTKRASAHDDDVASVHSAYEVDSTSAEDRIVDHFDFTWIMDKLPHIQQLDITYAVRNVGMNFEWHLFSFTNHDCEQLCECIKLCKTLRVLKIYRSKIDDDQARLLILALLGHQALQELDLSHNLLGDKGARALGKLLSNSQIVKLNLCNNRIRGHGGKAIAYGLTKNTTLTHLNMRLNAICDEGGEAMFRALAEHNKTLQEINLASTNLTGSTSPYISQCLRENTTLTSLDLSCNKLGEECGQRIHEAINTNKTMQKMDMRLTEIGPDGEFSILQVLKRNQEAERMKSENWKRQLRMMPPQKQLSSASCG